MQIIDFVFFFLDRLPLIQYLSKKILHRCPSLSTRKNANERPETEKVPTVVIKKIREAILDEVFKPGDHLVEVGLAEKFEVSWSPVREALLALEKEGTLIDHLKSQESDDPSR